MSGGYGVIYTLNNTDLWDALLFIWAGVKYLSLSLALSRDS